MSLPGASPPALFGCVDLVEDCVRQRLPGRRQAAGIFDAKPGMDVLAKSQVLVALVLGFWGTWRALAQKAAPLLRND